MLYRTPSQGPQLCSSCGSKLVAGDCVECDRPRSHARGSKPKAAPARAYNEIAGRATEPAPDYRRSSGEWLNKPTDDAPATRRAHPGQVRTALAEAEVKAMQKAEGQAARTSVTQSAMAAVRSDRAETERERNPDGTARRHTSPRMRPVTPLPPEPIALALASEPAAPRPETRPAPRPETRQSYLAAPEVGPVIQRRPFVWAYAAAAGVAAAALAFLLTR